VHRDQGLIVPPGNPRRLTGIADLAEPGLRYVNRQRGAGTRALLDHELAQRDIDPAQVSAIPARNTPTSAWPPRRRGARRRRNGHPSRARAFNLDFVPVAREPYDLVLRTSMVEDSLLAPLWALLKRPDFQAGVEALGGYSCVETGRRIR
jgi:putative molybdopterin biosynthesis protein